ncbi:hypothetical protein [Hahella sp. HN01]|uniref:hypothetical protein n=1 Tax=Hahella sp. HN01 TaxID=2847262 RepID=UPI001C1E991E|nr:hypothetical protein [Hahella sp. HN01]MBU6956020.1 hypothetical protein [Hahella sp. HN01]
MERKELLLNSVIKIDLTPYARCFDQIDTVGLKGFLFNYDCKETFVCVGGVGVVESVSCFLAGAHKIFLSEYEMHGEKAKDIASVFEGDMNESIAKARLMESKSVEGRLKYCVGGDNIKSLCVDVSSESVKEAIYYGPNDDQFLFILRDEIYYVDCYPG